MNKGKKRIELVNKYYKSLEFTTKEMIYNKLKDYIFDLDGNIVREMIPYESK